MDFYIKLFWIIIIIFGAPVIYFEFLNASLMDKFDINDKIIKKQTNDESLIKNLNKIFITFLILFLLYVGLGFCISIIFFIMIIISFGGIAYDQSGNTNQVNV